MFATVLGVALPCGVSQGILKFGCIEYRSLQKGAAFVRTVLWNRASSTVESSPGIIPGRVSALPVQTSAGRHC